VEDFATALIRYDNGAVTLLETSYDINGKEMNGKMLYGTKGGLDLSDGVKLYGTCNDFLADIDIKTTHYKEHAGGFDTEIAHFVDCVRNGTPCKAPAEDGIVVMKILDAIYKSAETGEDVKIEY
jgi:predicted dehydrogenase